VPGGAVVVQKEHHVRKVIIIICVGIGKKGTIYYRKGEKTEYYK
jgi:hypothetical protein